MQFRSIVDRREHRAFYDRALEECRRRGRDENAINGYHSKLRTIYELATDPRLLAIVEDLMGGESFSCVMTNYLCKLPRSDKYVPWHQVRKHPLSKAP